MKQLVIAQKEMPYEIAEELKTLRTNIQFCGSDKRVILVTSCLSGEGKSTTTLALARSLTELGEKVLLIDSDLRKSVLKEKVKGGQIAFGLTHYLIGQAALEQVIYQTEMPDLHVIPAGATPPNPSELLSNARMVELIRTAKEHYDYVIVDCAPLGMVVDAAVVAPYCDGAVLLIEAGTIAYRFAQEVSAKLKNTKCPILGVVLNKVDRQSDAYYGYGKYNKYYDKRYEEYYR